MKRRLRRVTPVSFYMDGEADGDTVGVTLNLEIYCPACDGTWEIQPGVPCTRCTSGNPLARPSGVILTPEGRSLLEFLERWRS